MITTDYKTYYAINGRWTQSQEISVFKNNGVAVSSDEYIKNPQNGTISFYSTQNADDQFMLCVELDPSFRIICKIDNYGRESVKIHHIGVIYNILKRINRTSQGIIVHKTIGNTI